MKLKELSNEHFFYIKTSIGGLYLFSLRVKEHIELFKINFEEVSNKEFFQIFLPYVAYLEKDLIGDEFHRPENYTLQKSEILKLSNEECEKISKKIVENNKYLYKKTEIVKSKEDKGQLKININTEGQIDKSLFKKDDELYIDLLYRLFYEYKKREEERLKGFTSAFSSSLSKTINQTIGFGESLKDSFSTINKVLNTKPFNENILNTNTLSSPVFDYAEQIKRNEERRLEPFKELSSKIDVMIEAEQQTVLYMNDVNKTQIEIANELKKSSDSTNITSKKNINYTKIIIVLTILTTLVTIFAFSHSIWFDKDANKVIASNQEINNSLLETNNKIESLTKILVKQNQLQNNKIDSLNKEKVNW